MEIEKNEYQAYIFVCETEPEHTFNFTTDAVSGNNALANLYAHIGICGGVTNDDFLAATRDNAFEDNVNYFEKIASGYKILFCMNKQSKEILISKL